MKIRFRLTAMAGALLLALAAAPAVAAEELMLSGLRLLEVLPIAATLHHVQGIDVDGSRLWVTSVDRASRKGYLHLVELPSGKLLREAEVQQGDRFHPGGITLDGSSVWLPVAEYQRTGRSVVQRRDRLTLALLESFEVDDHIGCIAAAKDLLIGGNWDSRMLYFWDRRGRLIEKRENPSPSAFQDMKLVGGALVASGTLAGQEGIVEWRDPRSLALRRSLRAGITDRSVRYTNEGMTLRRGKLYLLPEDGPSRLFVFRLPK